MFNSGAPFANRTSKKSLFWSDLPPENRQPCWQNLRIGQLLAVLSTNLAFTTELQKESHMKSCLQF